MKSRMKGKWKVKWNEGNKKEIGETEKGIRAKWIIRRGKNEMREKRKVTKIFSNENIFKYKNLTTKFLWCSVSEIMHVSSLA